MSAFVVDRNHIRVLVEAALQSGRYDFTIFHNGARLKLVADEQFAGAEGEISATEAGQRLWDENIRSVTHRYPESGEDGMFDPESLPGPVGETYRYEHLRAYGWTADPGAIFSAIDCYGYQSCETEDWRSSWAWEFTYALRGRFCRKVPGFDGFNVADIPEAASRVVSLMDMIPK